MEWGMFHEGETMVKVYLVLFVLWGLGWLISLTRRRKLTKSMQVFLLALPFMASGGVVYAESAVDELPDITGGAIAVLYRIDTFGSGGQLFSGGHLSSRGAIQYQVRVVNRSGATIQSESLVVVVDVIQEAARLRDVTADLEVLGAHGQTENGKPYFLVPNGGSNELGPYGKSEPFTLEIRNPDLLRLYPPVLRVHGLRRTGSKTIQEALRVLVEKGLLSSEEAQQVLEQS